MKMNAQVQLRISLIYLICHLLSYFFISIPYYHLFLKEFYIGNPPVFSSFLVTELDGNLWQERMLYFFPVQMISALLGSLFLGMLYDYLQRLSYAKLILIIFWMKAILGGLVAVPPSPGTLEGFLFLRSEFSVGIQLLVFSEICFQATVCGVLFGFLFKRYVTKIQ